MIVKVTDRLVPKYASSLVDVVGYDRETGKTFITLNGETYCYNNARLGDAEKIVNAPSAGREYANFKLSFGPSSYVGSGVKIEQKTTTIQNTTSISSSSVFGGTLTKSELYTKTDPKRFKVGFIVSGDSTMKFHTLYANSATEAYDSVLKLGTSLGIAFTIKEVTIYFD